MTIGAKSEVRLNHGRPEYHGSFTSAVIKFMRSLTRRYGVSRHEPVIVSESKLARIEEKLRKSEACRRDGTDGAEIYNSTLRMIDKRTDEAKRLEEGHDKVLLASNF